MSRVAHWEQNMESVLQSYTHGRDYELGKSDCLSMASAVVSAITGRRDRWAKDWRGKYSTREEAETLVKKYGGFINTFTLFFDSEINFDMRGVHRGDICFFIDDEKTPHLTVCVGAKMMGYFEHGLRALPINSARGYWRIN